MGEVLEPIQAERSQDPAQPMTVPPCLAAEASVAYKKAENAHSSISQRHCPSGLVLADRDMSHSSSAGKRGSTCSAGAVLTGLAAPDAPADPILAHTHNCTPSSAVIA